MGPVHKGTRLAYNHTCVELQASNGNDTISMGLHVHKAPPTSLGGFTPIDHSHESKEDDLIRRLAQVRAEKARVQSIRMLQHDMLAQHTHTHPISE